MLMESRVMYVINKFTNPGDRHKVDALIAEWKDVEHDYIVETAPQKKGTTTAEDFKKLDAAGLHFKFYLEAKKPGGAWPKGLRSKWCSLFLAYPSNRRELEESHLTFYTKGEMNVTILNFREEWRKEVVEPEMSPQDQPKHQRTDFRDTDVEHIARFVQRTKGLVETLRSAK